MSEFKSGLAARDWLKKGKGIQIPIILQVKNDTTTYYTIEVKDLMCQYHSHPPP
jgi:hypothetical protein